MGQGKGRRVEGQREGWRLEQDLNIYQTQKLLGTVIDKEQLSWDEISGLATLCIDVDM